MSRLLALETSQAMCSVAYAENGEIFVLERRAPRQQTELLLPLIDEALSRAGRELADLDGVAFGRGPGSFTGLRIATAAAQGLGLAAGLPLVGVSSMACIAQAVASERRCARILVCLDARLREVYWGDFRMTDGLAGPRREEAVSPPDAVVAPEEDFVAAGSAFASEVSRSLQHVSTRAALVDGDVEPSAREVAILGAAALHRGEAVPATAGVPSYLRKEVVRRP